MDPSHTRMRPRADAHEVFAAIREHQGNRRFAGRSDDDTVSATVDGSGALHELSIAERVLRGPFPERAGPSVVAAVRAARRTAEEMRERLTERFFDPTQPDPDFGDTPPRPAEPVAPAQPRRVPRASSDDDFEQIDFVRPPAEPSGKGRR